MNSEGVEDGVDGGSFVPIATSGDDGMLQINEEICRNLFDINLTKTIPGLCLVSIIVDPAQGAGPLLMQYMLKHLTTQGRSIDPEFSEEDFANQFYDDLEKFEENLSGTPTLVACSKPLWAEKGASTSIPVYLLLIVGNFEDGYKDKNFIALAGLAIMMSSSTVTIIEEDLQVGSIDELVPSVVQGLRSEQLKQYEQLHILIRNATSGPFGNKDGPKILQQFWNANVENGVMSRLRTVFKSFNCHKLPKEGNPFVKKSLVKKFLSNIFDTTIKCKSFASGAYMKGDDIVQQMLNHGERVMDAEYQVALERFTAVGVIQRRSAMEENRWRDNGEADAIADDDDEEEELNRSSDSDVESASKNFVTLTQPRESSTLYPALQKEEDEISQMALAMGTLSIQPEVEKAPMRKKLSERFKLEDDKPEPSNDFQQSSPPNEAADDVTEAISSITEEKLKQANCLGTSKASIDQFPEEASFATIHGCEIKPEESAEPPQVTPRSSRQLVEIRPTKAEESDKIRQITLKRLQNSTIEIVNEASPDSIVTAEEIMKQSLQLLSNTTSDPMPSVMTEVTEEVTQSVRKLMTAVVQLQDDIENNFEIMTEESIIKMLDDLVDSYPDEIFKPSLKQKLDDLTLAYTGSMERNKVKVEKAMMQAVDHLAEKFKVEADRELDSVTHTNPDMEFTKHKLQSSYIKEAIYAFGDILNPKQVENLQAMMTERFETIFAIAVKSSKEKVEAEKCRMQKGIVEYVNQYSSEIGKAEVDAMTLGQLQESHNSILEKVVESFANEFGNYKLVVTFQNELKRKVESKAMTILSKFSNRISNATATSLKFVPLANSKADVKIIDKPVTSESILSKTRLSIGVHFGLSKVAMNFWDEGLGMSKELLIPRENALSFTDGEFKLVSLSNFVESGQVFLKSVALKLSGDVVLSGSSIIFVSLAILKQIAETQLAKQVDNVVLAIPSFMDRETCLSISKFFNSIGLRGTVILESDAVAIQHFAGVGLGYGFNATACIVVVLREKSYVCAGYSVIRGQIIRHHIQCVNKAKGKLGRLVEIAKSYWTDEFGAVLDSVIRFLPKNHGRNFKIILVSENRNIASPGMKDKVREVAPSSFSKEQSLSVCVAKGASFLASFENNHTSAIDRWAKSQSSYSKKGSNLTMLSTETGGDKGIISGWWVASKERNEVTIVEEISAALSLMHHKREPSRVEFRNYLSNKLKEIQHNADLSEHLKSQISGIIQYNIGLLKILDVDEEFCKTRRSKIDKEIDVILRNNAISVKE